MILLNGKKIAEQLNRSLKEKISLLKGQKPCLALIRTGNHPPSLSYIRTKKNACLHVGIASIEVTFPSSISEKELLEKIYELNGNKEVDGILVQLPLPPHLDEKKILSSIDPNKDVDGLHPLNMGKLLLGDPSAIPPCTAKGIHVLLKEYSIPLQGKQIVIMGRSNIVGKPLAAILLQNTPDCNATVTIVNSFTKNLQEITSSADVLIVAIGKPHFVTENFVKNGSTVIDVGINRILLSEGKTQIVGDVNPESVSKKVSHLSPVPGGVGPMTVAFLLQNTWTCFQRKISKNP